MEWLVSGQRGGRTEPPFLALARLRVRPEPGGQVLLVLSQHIPKNGELPRRRVQEPFVKVVKLALINRQERQRRAQLRLAVVRRSLLLPPQERLRVLAERAALTHD